MLKVEFYLYYSVFRPYAYITYCLQQYSSKTRPALNIISNSTECVLHIHKVISDGDGKAETENRIDVWQLLSTKVLARIHQVCVCVEFLCHTSTQRYLMMGKNIFIFIRCTNVHEFHDVFQKNK